MAVSIDYKFDLGNLPNLVIDKILGLIPTKTAIQASFPSKQWKSVLTSVRALNFEEPDDFECHSSNLYSEYQDQHKKFINFLNDYLEYRKKNERESNVLDRLNICMEMYSPEDATIISKWIDYACERCVKSLDIIPMMSEHPNSCGLPGERPEAVHCYSHYYIISLVTFANAKFLTTLYLGRVRICNITQSHHEPLLPALETLTLDRVWLACDDFSSILQECPSLNYLSLVSCGFKSLECYVSSSSLKTLIVDFCPQIHLQVDGANNLETFEFVTRRNIGSPSLKYEKVILNNLRNLKNVYICADGLWELSILGCHPALIARINCKHVEYFDFFDGYLDAVVCVDACEKARISIVEVFNSGATNSTYFVRLIRFLNGYSSCKKISIYNRDVEALVVPKKYRKASPLPKCKILEVRMPNPPTMGSSGYLALMNSCRWIAPYALISIRQVDVEQDRMQVDQRACPLDYSLIRRAATYFSFP